MFLALKAHKQTTSQPQTPLTEGRSEISYQQLPVTLSCEMHWTQIVIPTSPPTNTGWGFFPFPHTTDTYSRCFGWDVSVDLRPDQAVLSHSVSTKLILKFSWGIQGQRRGELKKMLLSGRAEEPFWDVFPSLLPGNRALVAIARSHSLCDQLTLPLPFPPDLSHSYQPRLL